MNPGRHDFQCEVWVGDGPCDCSGVRSPDIPRPVLTAAERLDRLVVLPCDDDQEAS